MRRLLGLALVLAVIGSAGCAYVEMAACRLADLAHEVCNPDVR